MIFEVGMRIRQTRSLDKQRGFVNGASGTVEYVLSKGCLVLRAAHGNHILVHPRTPDLPADDVCLRDNGSSSTGVNA